jgi:hypothetical protein
MIRHHHRITHAAAVALALTALVAPPALAMTAPASHGPCSEVCSNGGYGPGSDVSSTNGNQSTRIPATVVGVAPGDSGFNWGDAGIGAGAALGLILAATGGTLLLAHRRAQSHTAG